MKLRTRMGLWKLTWEAGLWHWPRPDRSAQRALRLARVFAKRWGRRLSIALRLCPMFGMWLGVASWPIFDFIARKWVDGVLALYAIAVGTACIWVLLRRLNRRELVTDKLTIVCPECGALLRATREGEFFICDGRLGIGVFTDITVSRL